MDIVRAVECYVDKIVRSVSGLKVLLLDPDTVNQFFEAFFNP